MCRLSVREGGLHPPGVMRYVTYMTTTYEPTDSPVFLSDIERVGLRDTADRIREQADPHDDSAFHLAGVLDAAADEGMIREWDMDAARNSGMVFDMDEPTD
jgi:hypothetical protein